MPYPLIKTTLSIFSSYGLNSYAIRLLEFNKSLDHGYADNVKNCV